MKCRLEQLVDDARAGRPCSLRAAARLMSIMTDQPQRLAEMLACSRDWPQPRLVLGVTGAPGSGKSTLVDHLAAEHRSRYPQRRLGIVAVDPSSPFTGGALLGDRVRMMRHATDPGVFIRSLASRGRLGGLALGAKGVVRVMGLIGCDVVIVETVGVGQSEVDIARNADITVVVLAPGHGDSIQMLKAGLIEAGDVFVVNKADREDAPRLYQQLHSALQIGRRIPRHGGDETARHRRAEVDDATPVFFCSALNHQGVDALSKHLESLAVRHADAWQIRRRGQALGEVREALVREVEQRLDAFLRCTDAAERRLTRVLNGATSIGETADELLSEIASERKRPPSQSSVPRRAEAHLHQDAPARKGNER